MKFFSRLLALSVAALLAVPAIAQTGRTQNDLANIGAPAAQPASGTVKYALKRANPEAGAGTWRLDITLTNARIPVTDAAGSGSSGSLKLIDFNEQAIMVLGCRQDYTAFAEGAALTGAAGDAAFVMGLGSVAANAGDAALTSTEVDFCAVTGTITLSGGTGVGTILSGAIGAINGTATATDLILNWSGSAATIDANSTIDVTGTITVLFDFMGDD